MKFLVADDEAITRELLKCLLESQGHAVDVAANGKAALEIASHSLPDAVISDILMPEMDGFMLCRKIKGNANLRKIPLIFYTSSYLSAEDEKLALALGASAHLKKPMEPKLLLQTIESIIREYQGHKLTVPGVPIEDTDKLTQMYEDALVQKLTEKVKALKKEITEHKQTEGELQKQERRLLEAQKIAHLGFIEVNLETDEVYLSDEAYRSYGIKKGEIGTMSELVSFVHPDDLELVQTRLDMAVRGEQTYDLEHRLVRPDGSIIWTHSQAELIRDSSGKPIQLIGTTFDISKRRQAEEALKASLNGTIVVISKAVEARDPYTAGHQQRVARLAHCIAQEMGLGSDRIDGLRMGATIHDIGKIHLPAEILSKPAKLTETEFEFIKSHAQVGYDILKDIKFPWPIADIAHQHHERLDGTGYPQGLKGEEICLEARIVAVADVVEAISSHRPYRPSLGINVALEEIEAHRGEWYEPVAVDICLRLFQEKKFSLED